MLVVVVVVVVGVEVAVVVGLCWLLARLGWPARLSRGPALGGL